jgi:hypothetical protein
VDQEKVWEFEQLAAKIVESVRERNQDHYVQLKQGLTFDEERKTFPFLTVILFLRAGLQNYVSHYCESSPNE